MRAALERTGVAPASIQAERFAPPAGGTGPAVVEESRVLFSRTGKTALWRAESGLTLLEFAEAHGLAPDFGCRAGTCHSCAVRLVAGSVAYDAPPPVPPPDGQVLPCCARPDTAMVALDL